MRLLIQRVDFAKLSIEGRQYATIGKGLLVFLGITHNDSMQDINYLCTKLLNLRIFPDPENKMNLSVKDIQGEILLVSQFTLYASTRKGNRPSFADSAPPELAIPLYQAFIHQMTEYLPDQVKTGEFGADMRIELLNNGPVTLSLDSRNKE